MPLPFSRRALQTAPSFSRDFAGLKTLDHGVGPAITFTRASNATFFDAAGTLQTAANDTPRFDHSAGSSLGLLIEEARTNLLTRSAELDNAAWSKSGGTITANADTAPDATTTADKFVESAANETHQVFQTVTGVAAIQTASFFVKAAGRTSCQFLAFNATDGSIGRVNVDLTNGTTSSVIGTATVTSVGNGWYRVAVTYTPTVTNTSFNIFPREGGSTSYLGDGTSGILIWGAQLEAGAFPTSYIPTTTAAATRAADSAVVTPISSFYNQSEGTLYSLSSRTADGSGGFPAPLRVYRTANDSRFIQHWVASAGTSAAFKVAGGANGADISRSGLTANTQVAICGAYATNNVIAAINGTLTSQDTLVDIPDDLDRFQIGTYGPFSSFLNGHIRRIAYWPRRLSNTLLQQLTT